MNPDLKREILQKLQLLHPQYLDLQDESAEHIGHVEASAGCHLQLVIVTDQFDHKTRLQRHRLVYECLVGLIPHPIHALAIQAYSQKEFNS